MCLTNETIIMTLHECHAIRKLRVRCARACETSTNRHNPAFGWINERCQLNFRNCANLITKQLIGTTLLLTLRRT